MQQLTKRLLESAPEGEITDHLGYDNRDPTSKNCGNSRGGKRRKTVLPDIAPVEISAHQDRDGTLARARLGHAQERLAEEIAVLLNFKA